MGKIQEVLGLLDRSVLENSPTVQKLIKDFKAMLPNHFGNPYIVPASVNSNLKTVLRANCSN